MNLDELSYDELLALNHEIVERLKFLDSIDAFNEMRLFELGAKVSFDSNAGKQLGTVFKHNRKTVGVLTESGRRWKVSPHLLTLVKEVKPNQHVISINKNRNKKKNKRKR